MKFWPITLFVACLGLSTCTADAGEAPLHQVQVFSDSYVIDRIYEPMSGPGGRKTFNLEKNIKPELLWITGGKLEVLKDAKTKTEGYLCHANMRFDPAEFNAKNPNADFNHKTHQPLKLISLGDRQETILPEGFGIPVMSTKLFEFNFAYLNEHKPDEPFSLNASATFKYLRDVELKKEIKPLFLWNPNFKVPLAKGATKSSHCDMANMADMPSMDNTNEPKDELGPQASAPGSVKRVFGNEKKPQTDHWMVPPGRHAYHYKIEESEMRLLPFDSTMHYANVHIHPYIEFVELVDVTTGKTLFKMTAKSDKDGANARVQYFTSKKGVPIFKDHEFELICQYNNTTEHEVDAMATIFIYLLDKDFERDQLRTAKGL